MRKTTGSLARARGAVLVLLFAVILASCAAPWLRQTSPEAAPRATATATTAGGGPTACGTGAASQPTATPPPSASATAAPSPLAVAQANAQRVLQTPRPVRDLYSLTQHLIKHTAQPIAPRVRTTPRNERMGQVTTFWVINPSQSGYHQIQATLVYVTPHVYMYLQNGASADISALRASADTFEQQIYPKDRAFFGNEWSPGPDDDQHITLLYALNLGPIGGYFSSQDEYPQAVSSYSNERQMIYVNLSGGEIPGTERYASTLAHEFQHMIHWRSHPADPSWANEGSSVLAQHINGYSADNVEAIFLRRPETMLGGWTDDEQADIAHYGAGYLFMAYFTEHYGGNTVLSQLLADPAQTPLNFNNVLAAHGYSDRFDDVFAKFVLANLLNDTSFGAGAYGYPSIPNERATPQHATSSYPYADGSDNAPAQVPQYAAAYYDFTPSGTGARTLRLTFQGSPWVNIVANQPYAGAAAEWWSNSGNNMDSTLTRAFDLTALAGKSASLCFNAWYSLEPDFDYAYVEASTDGGQNWTTLPTTTSMASNPNGENYG
ncbi:MAG: immune inhibitor A, partial [Ktedonobacterales bacterium]|nr:immune inhibitor A [Ktedonobacterales bacterium]